MYTTLKDGGGTSIDHLGRLSRRVKGKFPKMNVDVVLTRPGSSQRNEQSRSVEAHWLYNGSELSWSIRKRNGKIVKHSNTLFTQKKCVKEMSLLYSEVIKETRQLRCNRCFLPRDMRRA